MTNLKNKLTKAFTNSKSKRLYSYQNQNILSSKIILKEFQIKRLQETHQDLYLNKGTKKATEFFLNELYGFKDLRNRDIECEKLIPILVNTFPEQTLKLLTEAFELDSLTENLETKMAEELIPILNEGIKIEDVYWKMYVLHSTRKERLEQLNLVKNIGVELCEVVKIPFIEQLLFSMRFPSKLLKVGEIHNFLENGFKTFKYTENPINFVNTIYERELKILEYNFSSKILK